VGHVSELKILATSACFASGVELLMYLWIISCNSHNSKFNQYSILRKNISMVFVIIQRRFSFFHGKKLQYLVYKVKFIHNELKDKDVWQWPINFTALHIKQMLGW
jgi:hypothetical protein